MPTGMWHASPSEALWYGKVVGSPPGEDITYVDGYSADPDADIRQLAPDGWEVEEATIRPTSNNTAGRW